MEDSSSNSLSPRDVVPPWELLDRYFAGEATAPDRDIVERWSGTGTDTADEIQRLRGVWEQAPGQILAIDVERALASVRGCLLSSEPPRDAGHGIGATDNVLVGATDPRTDGRVSPIWRRVVATLVGGVAVASALFGAWMGADELADRSVSRVRNIAYVTARGQQGTIHLADGTNVMLNAATTLTVSPDFGQATRELTLDGEAAFTVQHAAGTPFIIQAGRVRTVVLGTTFSMRSYRDDAVTRVAVAEGRVSVGHTILTQGDIATTVDGQQVNVTQHQNVFAVMSWRSGVIEVVQSPIAATIVELERFYNVDIVLGDAAVYDHVVTGAFTGRTIDDLTLTLEYILNVRVVRRGRTLLLLQK